MLVVRGTRLTGWLWAASLRVATSHSGARKAMENAMFEIKRISPDAIPTALEKAMRYRLLNEPMQAESICIDILELQPENRDALITLLLALTDQFDRHNSERVRRAREVLDRIDDQYSRLYYEGIICERQAKAHVRQGGPGSGHYAFVLLQKAMDLYEEAQAHSPEGTDDAVLRWNTCARIIMTHAEVEPEPQTPSKPVMLE